MRVENESSRTLTLERPRSQIDCFFF